MRADTRPITLLLEEVDRYLGEGRYAPMRDAARRAVTLATALDAPGLRLKATYWEAAALRMLGDKGGALARLTQVLGWAEDPALQGRLAEVDVRGEVARAYMDWVECARFLPGMPAARLFAVLDAGEAWLRAVGRAGWRAGLLRQRAELLAAQGRLEEAAAAAEEALALAQRAPAAPGYTLATHRWALGDLLRRLDRYADARRHYRAVLDDPGSNAHGRFATHVGLARCAVAAEQGAEARRHAEAAVALAEGLGDDSLCGALEALVAACRADSALDVAGAAADRHLALARRLGSDHRLYFALRDAADVALDRGDAATARAHIAEARPLAAAMDRDNGTTEEQDALDACAARLAALEAPPD